MKRFTAFALLLLCVGVQAQAQSKAQVACAQASAQVRIAQDIAVENMLHCMVYTPYSPCGLDLAALNNMRRLSMEAALACILRPSSSPAEAVGSNKAWDIYFHAVKSAKEAYTSMTTE